MAEGYEPQPDKLFLTVGGSSGFTNLLVFHTSANDTMIFRGILNSTDYLQLVVSGATKTMSLVRKLNNGSEETLVTFTGE